MQEHVALAAELRDVPLLVGLSEPERREVLEAMAARSFEPGEVVLRQGIVTQNVWLLTDGLCEVVKEPPLGTHGSTVKLAEMGPYETFGEMTIFTESPHWASVWAQTQVTALKLRRADFDRLAEARPEIGGRLLRNMVNILSDRLRRMDDWIAELLDDRDEAVLRERWEAVRERLRQRFHGYVMS